MCVYARFLNAYKPSGKEQLSPLLASKGVCLALFFLCSMFDVVSLPNSAPSDKCLGTAPVGAD